MPTFHATNPLVTEIDEAVLDAQRQTNALLAGFPHPDVRTPEGLATLRTLTANNDQGSVAFVGMPKGLAGTKRVRIRGLAGTLGHRRRLASHCDTPHSSDEVHAPENPPAYGHPTLPYWART